MLALQLKAMHDIMIIGPPLAGLQLKVINDMIQGYLSKAL